MIPIVLDSNVLYSGMLNSSGPPGILLDAWRDGALEIIVASEIFAEYVATGEKLGEKYPQILPDVHAILQQLITRAPFFRLPDAGEHKICDDPSDDKFILLAVSSGAILVSGDKKVVACSGYMGVRIVTPRVFVDEHLLT